MASPDFLVRFGGHYQYMWLRHGALIDDLDIRSLVSGVLHEANLCAWCDALRHRLQELHETELRQQKELADTRYGAG